MLVYRARPTFSCSPEVGGGVTHLSVTPPPTSGEQEKVNKLGICWTNIINCTTLVIMAVVTCNSVSINICHQWRRPAVNDTRLLGYSLPCFLVTQPTTWLYFTCVPLTAFLRRTEILNCDTVWYPKVPAMLDQS